MKATLRVDAAQCQYGAATAAVRQILSEWAAIDWLVPPDPAADATAMSLFADHQRLSWLHAPDLFQVIEIRTVHGSFADFSALCAQVRAEHAWDWKYSALKPLSSRHAQACGWSLRDAAPDLGSLEAGREPRAPGAGDLFFRFGEVCMWNTLGPALELTSVVPPGHLEPARFYLSYTGMDAQDCVQWQLARNSSDLAGNPFLPLVRCYAAGFYPFALARDTVRLFAFQE